MSQFQPAFLYMMANEDSQHKCEIVPDAPPGAHAISGINSAAYHIEYASIAAIPQDQRFPAVSSFYQLKFWNPLQAGGIESQDIANRVLDQAVNGGLFSGAQLLQRATNACGCKVAEDGHIGAATLEAVNSIDPDKLLAAYRAAREAHYRAIVAAKPEDEEYLAAWLARAQG